MGERERSEAAQQARLYVGEHLRRCREKRGLTQAQLAEHFQIEVRYLQYLEAGQSAPGMDLLVDLAAFFEVKVGDLFEPVEIVRRGRGRPPKGREG